MQIALRRISTGTPKQFERSFKSHQFPHQFKQLSLTTYLLNLHRQIHGILHIYGAVEFDQIVSVNRRHVETNNSMIRTELPIIRRNHLDVVLLSLYDSIL